MKTVEYLTPKCEYEVSIVVETLFTGSDLTDEGPGDILTGGDEYEF